MKWLLLFFLTAPLFSNAQLLSRQTGRTLTTDSIAEGAELTAEYFPLLRDKKVGVVCNHTAMIGSSHLVDSLLGAGITVTKVFVPEHGFRGEADAGEKIETTTDAKTGLPIVSLYGKTKKPSAEQLQDVDIMIFDIQDVGARFYTYISTMTYVMEACAENGKPVVILDRPNPNGHYVDGPVLKDAYKSFVGMHPVPIVHGMTVGEYACMVNGEKWLANGVSCTLTVIECENWNHSDHYQLPVKPSPNLPNMEAIYLYPTLCLFEGTPLSIGRGTDLPFQVVGHPSITGAPYSFTPESRAGAKSPKLEGKLCYGYNLSEFGKEYIRDYGMLYIYWWQDLYDRFPDKSTFFTGYFNTLAGTDQLQTMIKEGKTEEEIRAAWKTDLDAFKMTRKKYLLYKDFE